MSADQCWECGKDYPQIELLDIPVFKKYTVKWCFKCIKKQLKHSEYQLVKKKEFKKKYLRFEVESQYVWQVINEKNELLGWIKRVQVGQWMQYCLVYNKTLFADKLATDEDIYLSGSCQEEVREFCRVLKSAEIKGYHKDGK
jgi:hypothetical protein